VSHSPNVAYDRLRDVDDDVRAVAASALLSKTDILVGTLREDELWEILQTLWGCLAEDGDELGSSTGAVMDLIGMSVPWPS
jgi:TATA-binding protein-associated factor